MLNFLIGLLALGFFTIETYAYEDSSAFAAKTCHEFRKSSICYEASQTRYNEYTITNLTYGDNVRVLSSYDIMGHICETHFSFSHAVSEVSDKSKTFYSFKDNKIKKGFFEKEVIKEFKCSGVSLDLKDHFLERVKNLAIEIFAESYPDLLKIYDVRTIERVKEQLEIISFIDFNENYRSSWILATHARRGDGIVMVMPNFYSRPLIGAAGSLIHEAVHLAGILDECRAERVTIDSMIFSYKSEGLLPGGYKAACYTDEDLCGFPLVLKVNNLTNDLDLLYRSAHWIGGHSVCEKKFNHDINHDLQIDDDNILNGKTEVWPQELIHQFHSSPDFVSTKMTIINFEE